MTRITLVGGSTDRFIVDGIEGYLEIEKPLTDKQAKGGATVGVVFRADYRAPLDLDEPGHDVTPGHPDYGRVEADKQAERDAEREKAEKEAEREATRKAKAKS